MRKRTRGAKDWKDVEEEEEGKAEIQISPIEFATSRQDSRGLSCGLRSSGGARVARPVSVTAFKKSIWSTGHLTDRREVQRRARLHRFFARFFRSVSKNITNRKLSRLVRETTPAEGKSGLARVRAGTQVFGGACSDRHLQGATGALLSGFRLFASNSRCQIQLFCACCRQARQPAARAVRRRISRRP